MAILCDGCMLMASGAGRGKDMANITGHRGKDISTILQSEEGKENGRPPRPSAGQRKKKRRRLNDLDSDSTVDEEESEDEFCLSERYEEQKNTLKFSQQDHFFLRRRHSCFSLFGLQLGGRVCRLGKRIGGRIGCIQQQRQWRPEASEEFQREESSAATAELQEAAETQRLLGRRRGGDG